MGLLRKPYEISYWEDVWDSSAAKYVEKRMFTIGSDTMDYQARAIEPVLTRKTNGEVNFSFKMYYQFVDTMTGEDVRNPFVDHIINESKIKLNYNGEWFDLLVKNITEDSTTKSYSYQLVDQHMVELSKNGFNVELDSKLMNNLGTAEELAAKVLVDTDWDVESEKIVATQDEALVMLKVAKEGGIQAYRINDTNLTANGAVLATTTTTIPKDTRIYAFYSSCSGEKPYRFQFIYFTETPEFQSNRIITTQNCQYFIDRIDPEDGWWTGNENAEGKALETGFTVPKGLWVDTEHEDDDGNKTAISMKYRGRRYVYTQTSEYHAGLDMYLEKYTGFAHNREAYWVRESTESNWEVYSTKGYSVYWRYFSDSHKPELGEQYHVGDIVKMTHKEYAPFYAQVTSALYKTGTAEGKNEIWYFKATTVTEEDVLEYYKYTKTNYVTPNLIQNIVNNADFKGISGWKGSKYIDEIAGDNPEMEFKPITSYDRGSKKVRKYTQKQWDIYTMPYILSDDWIIGDEEDVKAEDRLAVGEYFYLTDCMIADDNDKVIYPLFQAVGMNSQNSTTNWDAISLGYITVKNGDTIKTKVPLSSPEFSATVESVSMKENEDGTLTSAIDAMLSGNTVIGDTDYNAYLLCGNLHKNIQINISDTNAEETIGQKTIINSGTSNTIAFQQGITDKEKYRFVLEASLIRKATTYGDTTTTTYSTSWSGQPAVTFDMKIAEHTYQSDLNGFSLSDYDADDFSESVLFVGKENSLSNTPLSLDLEALGSVDGKAMKEANYQLLLNFSNVPNPSVSGSTIYEYYILIKKIQFYKLYPKEDGEFYSPEDEITTENISYNIEEKYFPVITNDTRKLEEIAFASTDIDFKPVLSSDGAKKSSVNAKESNYFNIIQSIAETFECWPKLIVTHDANGNINGKKIKFFNYVGQPNDVGFRYGVNSKDIKRTLDSNQIVSKLIVKANSNEYAPNGFCSIARAAANDTKDNVIYDFGYYVNQKLIDATSLQKDLYTDDNEGAITSLTDETSGGLYITTKITESNVGNYISSCSGYYPKMRHINIRLEALSKLISQNSAPLNEEIATYNTYKTMYETAKCDLEDVQNRFYKLAGFAYNAIPDDEREQVLESSTLYPILKTIAELAQTETDAFVKYTDAQRKKTDYEDTLAELETQYDNALFLKATLNKLFYQRYSRFIQEGTWIDESYIDESLYYNDALSVAYNSSMPKITYSMNVLALAGLPGYEQFDFKVGDQTFVEDTEFFGYDNNGNPYQEKVTITQTSENLDDPTKNTIQIRNYANQFEDLFQRITATVQSVQYTEGSYKKASALAEADAAHKFSFLTDALTAAEAAINSTDNSVNIDMTTGTGITITSTGNTDQALRLTSGAILLKGTDPDTGDKIWKTGLTAQGISASLVTAGTINTGEINIMNGSDPTFRWDTHGITAYDFDNSVSDVWLTGINKNKGVRFDRFGLYGYKLPQDGVLTGENWKPTGIDTGANSIEEHSTFSLTWKGLKVKSENGATVRIGDNAKVNSADKDLIKITDSNNQPCLQITETGNLLIGGTGSVGQFQMVDNKLKISLSDVDTMGNLYYGTKDWTTDRWGTAKSGTFYTGWEKTNSSDDPQGNTIVKSTTGLSPNLYQEIQAMAGHYYKVSARVRLTRQDTGGTSDYATISMCCDENPGYAYQDMHQAVTLGKWYTIIMYWQASNTEPAQFWVNRAARETASSSDNIRTEISSLCVKEMMIESWSDFDPEVEKLESGESYNKGVLAVGVIADPEEGDPLQLWEDNTSDKATMQFVVEDSTKTLNSKIEQTARGILQEVSDKEQELQSKIDQTADSILLGVYNKPVGDYSGSFSGFSGTVDYFTVDLGFEGTDDAWNFFSEGRVIEVKFTGNSALTRNKATYLNIKTLEEVSGSSSINGYPIKKDGEYISATKTLEWKPNEYKSFRFHVTEAASDSSFAKGYWELLSYSGSQLKIDVDGISTEVFGEDGKFSKLKQTVDSISTEVFDKDGNSKITQKANEIFAAVQKQFSGDFSGTTSGAFNGTSYFTVNLGLELTDGYKVFTEGRIIDVKLTGSSIDRKDQTRLNIQTIREYNDDTDNTSHGYPLKINGEDISSSNPFTWTKDEYKAFQFHVTKAATTDKLAKGYWELIPYSASQLRIKVDSIGTRVGSLEGGYTTLSQTADRIGTIVADGSARQTDPDDVTKEWEIDLNLGGVRGPSAQYITLADFDEHANANGTHVFKKYYCFSKNTTAEILKWDDKDFQAERIQPYTVTDANFKLTDISTYKSVYGNPGAVMHYKTDIFGKTTSMQQNASSKIYGYVNEEGGRTFSYDPRSADGQKRWGPEETDKYSSKSYPSYGIYEIGLKGVAEDTGPTNGERLKIYDDMWYPFILPVRLSSYEMTYFSIEVVPNSSYAPSWSGAGGGIGNVSITFEMLGDGWGTTGGNTNILGLSPGLIKQPDANFPISIEQHTQYSRPVIWLRGGAKYRIRSNLDTTATWIFCPLGYAWYYCDPGSASSQAYVHNIQFLPSKTRPKSRGQFAGAFSEITQLSDQITAKVNKTMDGVQTGCGWDLSSSAFKVQSYKDGFPTDVMIVNENGLKIMGNATFTGTVNATGGYFGSEQKNWSISNVGLKSSIRMNKYCRFIAPDGSVTNNLYGDVAAVLSFDNGFGYLFQPRKKATNETDGPAVWYPILTWCGNENGSPGAGGSSPGFNWDQM